MFVGGHAAESNEDQKQKILVVLRLGAKTVKECLVLVIQEIHSDFIIAL